MSSFFEFSYTENDLSLVPKREVRSNKGTYGKVLCVCGSAGMAGASYLSALGAYRTGAGLVEIFAPEENRVILQTLIPEAILKIYDSKNPNLDLLEDALNACDSVALGCGLGKSSSALAIVKTVLKSSAVPTVIDADALNLLSEHPVLMKYAKGKIITPHIKEMSRLTGLPISDILDNPKSTAAEFAAKHSLVCVLKDSRTVVSDGTDRIYVNNSGNNGMATGGSGDVLTGVIASLLSQAHGSLSNLEAASLGVYIHGRAGDTAAEKLGAYAVMARDIADNIRI